MNEVIYLVPVFVSPVNVGMLDALGMHDDLPGHLRNVRKISNIKVGWAHY